METKQNPLYNWTGYSYSFVIYIFRLYKSIAAVLKRGTACGVGF